MTLKDQMAADVAGVFLNTDDFAEGFTHTPKGGIPRSVTLTIVDERVRFETRDNRKLRIRELEILAAHDATTGITNPQPGDKLTQDSDSRLPKVPLLFVDVVSQDDAGVILRYHESPRVVRGGYREQNTLS